MADAAALSQARSLVTPEGVDLRVRLANMSERAIALIIDLLMMVLALVLLTWAAAAAFGAAGNARGGLQAIEIIWLLGWFLLRNFYFTLFECTPRAATIGKRIMGLRVAARSGGALSADAVFARNAMRELELYLPIIFLIIRGSDVGALIVLAGLVWCGVFLVLPLFNKDRLRMGDIIAGTWVLKTPKQPLLPDLAGEATGSQSFAFSEAQLDKYGVKELQVLETVLRHANAEAMTAVAGRIRTKIDWRRGLAESDEQFLRAYYAALRRRLEQRLLFGVRKKDKFDPV